MTDKKIDLPIWLREVVQLDQNAQAIQFEGEWRNWKYLSDAVAALDEVLTPLNLGEGTTVGILMRNRPELVRSIFSVLATRRCVVTLSSFVPTTKLADEIRRLKLSVVIANANDWESGELLAAARDAGSMAIQVADSDGEVFEVLNQIDSSVEHSTAPGVAVQMLTSGTTGTPKRVDLTYRSLEFEVVSTASYSKSDNLSQPKLSTGVSIIWAPFLHISGLRGLISNFVAGRKTSLLERFNIEKWVAVIKEHRPVTVSLPPTAMRMVLDAKIDPEVFESVRAVFAGTAPVSMELEDEFYATFKVPVLVLYGATEFAGGVAGWTLSDWKQFHQQKRGSVGRANAGVQIRVIDPETDSQKPYGEEGVLEVKAPQLGTDAWVRTTDRAQMDADGFLWILGRLDDVIIRGGLKVSTNAVKEALCKHPSVHDAVVFGIPDARLGQVPVAAVETKDATNVPTEDDLKTFLRDLVSAYQIPIRILVVNELPRTPSLKVSQPAVKELLQV